MVKQHEIYLSLGSNIEPEANLRRALELLQKYGEIKALSSVWESQAVGSDGPNFLNASLLLRTNLSEAELKDHLVRPVEAALGRIRTEDKNAPRTIDIDVLMIDGRPMNASRWDAAFVLLPMAELLPDQTTPLTHERLEVAAKKARQRTWILQRPGILNDAH